MQIMQCARGARICCSCCEPVTDEFHGKMLPDTKPCAACGVQMIQIAIDFRIPLL
jgi:hypothetical protein